MKVRYPLIASRQIPVHIGAWLAILLGYTLLYYSLVADSWGILRGIVQVIGLAGLFYSILPLVHHYFPPRKYIQFSLWANLLLGLFSFLRGAFPLMVPIVAEPSELGLHFQISRQGILFHVVGPLFTNLAVTLFAIIYQTQQQRTEEDKRRLALQARQQEAELSFLRAQINPHFLFNTLNNIYTLSVIKSDRAPQMILKLSDLLRYITYDGQEETISLQKELNQIQAFIDLYQLRSERPLDIQFTRPEIDTYFRIEPLILIPLIENCFKHWDFQLNQEAFIRIAVTVSEQQLHITTQNSFDPQAKQKDEVGGVGLTNIRQRLALRYQDRYQLQIKAKAPIFQVDLTLPLLRPPIAHASSHQGIIS